MTDFLLLYQNGDPNWMDNKTPEEMGKQMQAWGDWFKQLEASGHLRNPGAALAKGGTVLTRNGNGFQTDATMSEVKELVGGFTLIQAKSVEEAAKIAEGSPFLTNNPKARILVRPVLQRG